MAHSPDVGTRLTASLVDRYRVEREIGAGGMATVYLAHDLRHDREVAIKVLHPDLGAALGGERFLAEIKTTARLQHPHILPLLDSGEADGLLFYVMPLVEGETLRERLTRERQLPIDVAVRIATEVAGALDYAHRHGVIHRDIKPENILLHDGRAVVADFGIALAVSAASGARMTQTGLSLGTPQYMSPEQATGEKQIDARADVYALGAVLYEMLTGEPPFSGATVQAIVAKVLTERPMHPTSVRDTIPPHIESTVLKALAKLPADRFGDAAKFGEALQHPEATAGYRATAAAPAAAAPVSGAARAWRVAPWALAAASTVLAAWLVARPRAVADASSPRIVAELTPLNRAIPVVIGANRPLTISRDGSQVVFIGVDSTRVPRLFMRATGSESLWAIPESEFGSSAAFSADGKTLSFVTPRQGLQAIGVGDSRPRALYRWDVAPGGFAPAGFVWEGDSALLFSENRGIYRIRASGGSPALVLPPPVDSNDRYLVAVPTRNGDLLVSVTRLLSTTGLRLVAFRRGESTPQETGLTATRFQLVQDSVLLMYREGSVRALFIDPRTFKPRGEPVVLTGSVTLVGQYMMAASDNGVLTFVAGAAATDAELVVVDRAGLTRTVLPQRQAYRFPRFAPDGQHIAFGVSGSRGPSSGDLWVTSLRDGRTLRVTSDGGSYHPEWAPDGRTLVHVRADSARVGVVFRTPADGTAPPAEVRTDDTGGPIWELQLTPDQRLLVFRSDNQGTGRDIKVTPLDSGGAATPLVASRFDEKGLALSPDGQWLAYASDEGGTNDVYLRRLTPGSPRWRVSVGGGVEPRWARTGELFYRRSDSVLVTRVRTAGSEPAIPTSQLVLRGEYDMSTFEPMWDVSPDGRRFVFVRRADMGRMKLMVMVNWMGVLRGGPSP